MNVPQELADVIHAFLYDHFPLAQQRKLADTDSLLESGVVDSMGILEIVTFLEQQFRITITDDEMVPETFDSVESLTQYVANKQCACYSIATTQPRP